MYASASGLLSMILIMTLDGVLACPFTHALMSCCHAGEAEEAESGSDTEAMSWARRPAAGGRTNTRRRRRVHAITGDASCSSQFRGVSKHRCTYTTPVNRQML